MKRTLLALSCWLLTPAAFAILDTNSNGVSDLWERKYNAGELFLQNFDPQADYDSDGWTNAHEAAAGTNPFAPNPPDGMIQPVTGHVLPVWSEPDENSEVYLISPEAVTVTWPTQAGKQYTLFYSPDLTPESWLPVGDPFIASGGGVTYGFPISQSEKCFWRVAVTDTDTDSDGLTDAEERQIGSSPYFSDTNNDGISDADALLAGNDPFADTQDGNGDGIPDNEIYSIMIETLSEYNTLEALPWHRALTGVDESQRYLTKVYSETYSITDSPRYQAVDDAVYSVTDTCQNETGELEAQPQKVEGVRRIAWQSNHGIVLGQGESIEWGTTQTTETPTPPTATVTTTTTTTTRPWTIKKDDNVVRSGTETAVETIRTELSNPITVQELWSRFKSRTWEEDQNGWQRAAPPGDLDPAALDASIAEWIREDYKSNKSPLFDWLSWPEQNTGRCGDRRMKAMRWRWVRFNPQAPGQYEYTAPPTGYSRSFHFLVMRWDRDYQTGEWPDAGQGLVELRCEGGEAVGGWNNVDMSRFASYRVQDPWKLATMDFTKGGRTQVFIQGVSAGLQKRMPVIADDGSDTYYRFESVSAVPREVPMPGVEIYQKSISGSQITLSAKVYDPLADVLESTTPRAWVNSRSADLVAGDKPGVYRLQGHTYKLYPGRNEITVAIENALGARGYETLVIEGDEGSGYSIIGEPLRVPKRPIYPVIFAAPGEDSTEVTLNVGAKSSQPGFESIWPGPFGEWWYRTNPFLAVLKPETATPAQIDAIPTDKPLFVSELEDDLTIETSYPGVAASVLELPLSGIELISPDPAEVVETTNLNPVLSFKARRMGGDPVIKAAFTTYRGDETLEDVQAKLLTPYKNAWQALPEEGKNAVVSFDVEDIECEEGYNGLAFSFGDSELFNHAGRHDSFRFPAPDKAGVRVFSANRKKDTVLDGVTGRIGDIWYPVAANADLSALGDALATSGCQVVGMTDLNDMFDNSPLKRSFLVRGPPGRTFQAFDQFYLAQGREQRSQTFDADGTHGAALAEELDRVQTDGDLPASAKNALALEIAGTYQFHNGFEDFVPKTHQPYVDPGTGPPQPNSWTMRGSSLPDHLQSNPTPWTVVNTVIDPARAVSASGIIKLDTTAEDTAYYASTSATAPWNLSGARAVSLRFKLLTHDAANGADGAFQLAAGDGTRTWTCQVAPAQVKVQGTTIALPSATFPSGLIDGKFHTLQFNFSGTGNDALVSIDGEVLTATAASEPGTLNGIAFGDPGAAIAGKLEIETLGFENSDLRYQYGYIIDDYADSDELTGGNNILLYLRSKGLTYEKSAIASWVNLLDQNVNEWLLGKYTGQDKLSGQQELYVYARSDVWLGSIVDIEDTEVDYSGIPYFSKRSKTSRCLNLDKEETKFFSSDQIRNEMQLAGLLMAWVYQQEEYKEWLAEKTGGGTGIDGLLLHKKHCVENIAKCAKHVETTLSVGGEIAVSITNEYVDYAITINNVRQGDYMAMVGFIPLVPSSTARAFKFINKIDGTLIEGIDRLCKKFPDFPVQKINNHVDDNEITRNLEVVNLFADHTDSVAVEKMRKLATNQQMSAHGPGNRGGYELLSTFSNQAVICYKTKEPTKAYRIFDGLTGRKESNFLLLEAPISKAQAEADYALGSLKYNSFQPNYDSWIEIEIPTGSYIFTGVAAKMDGKWVGSGRQVWIEDDVVNDSGIDWANAVVNVLPPG